MMNLDEEVEAGRTFRYRGKEFTVPDPEERPLKSALRIRALQKEIDALAGGEEDDQDKLVDLMRRQLKEIVPEFTDDDFDSLSKRQLVQLLDFLSPKKKGDPASPTPAEGSEPTPSAGPSGAESSG